LKEEGAAKAVPLCLAGVNCGQEVLMATLTLELEDDVLARAEAAAARVPGRTLQSVLIAQAESMAKDFPRDGAAALRRLFDLADANPSYLKGGMPSREERNAR